MLLYKQGKPKQIVLLDKWLHRIFPEKEKKIMNRIDIKMLHSNELRELRDMVKKELDFRADVGSELENKEKWLGADQWSERVQELRARERMHAYVDESAHSQVGIKTQT